MERSRCDDLSPNSQETPKPVNKWGLRTEGKGVGTPEGISPQQPLEELCKGNFHVNDKARRKDHNHAPATTASSYKDEQDTWGLNETLSP